MEREARRVGSACSPEFSARLVTSGLARSQTARLRVMYGSRVTADVLEEAVISTGSLEVLTCSGWEEVNSAWPRTWADCALAAMTSSKLGTDMRKRATSGGAKWEPMRSVGTSLWRPAAAGEMSLARCLVEG